MALTDNSDLFGAIHEDGINLVARHIMRQRPSLFNYGTQVFAQNPDRMCKRIDFTSDVLSHGNPLITLEPPLPILGSGGLYGMDFCAQLVRAEIDFHPGNVISLPPELNPPLAPQRVAIAGTLCGGLGCPPKEILLHFPTPPIPQSSKEGREERPPGRPPVVLPWRELTCFCLDLIAIGHIETEGYGTSQRLIIRLDGLEIVDVAPDELESMIECYLTTLLQLVILPRMNIALSALVLDVLAAVPGITFSLPTSSAVPNNPAIEDDQLMVFIEAGV